MILSLIFFLFIALGLGLPLILLISPKSNTWIKIGLSFPIGIGIFALLMFGTNLLGVKFSLLNESFLLALVSLPLIFLTRKHFKIFLGGPWPGNVFKLESVEKVMLGVILFLVTSSFVNTLYWPVTMWDSVVLYDFRGHIFAATGFMKDALTNEYYYSYPLLTSLAHSIVYMSGGQYPQFIYSIFYSSLGIGFYGLLREFVSRKSGLFFTLLLLTIEPIFSHSLYSYTNLTYTVYLGLGAILIYLWDKKNNLGYLVLSGLLIGLSTWVRAGEPFWMAAVLIVLILSVLRKKFWSSLVYFLMIIPIIKAWKLFQGSIAGGQVLVAGQGDNYSKVWSYVFDFTNWAMIFKYLYNHVVVAWGTIFILYSLTFIVVSTRKKNQEHFLMFLIGLVFLSILIMGIFIFSVYLDYWYRIGDAIERLSMLFYPLFMYSIALVVSNIKDGE